MFDPKSETATTLWAKPFNSRGDIHIQAKGMQVSITKMSAGRIRLARLS